MKGILIGVLFALLWASASVATKIGLKTAEPFVLTNTRFFLAALLMLTWAHLVRRQPFPKTAEYKPLLIYGLLNASVYLGVFSWAMRYATAGLGSLSVALNPLLIAIISAAFLKKKVSASIWLGLFLGIIGVGVVTFPVLRNSMATPLGVSLLFASMLSYSFGTVYFSKINWSIPRLVINGWQVLFGALTLLPVTLSSTDWNSHQWDFSFWGAVAWLAVPVSIGAVQLWLYLLHNDPVRAALWLYLCPVIGFFYAWWLVGEPVSLYTGVGTLLVIWGLYIGQRKAQPVSSDR
jgi:probable blue pigment (indigoidine) exporter